ncbi:hypothetical protein F7725_029184 [Dissostichus mawsoni]|uniref:Secreted protein n=1 Tax=Dissostichus mawsoni TaxID=36200 RepID=A0A7J5XHQ4_DISMA|nr:hypothetical protein F7725_029184 [Dissostichus mawsoni]
MLVFTLIWRRLLLCVKAQISFTSSLEEKTNSSAPFHSTQLIAGTGASSAQNNHSCVGYEHKYPKRSCEGVYMSGLKKELEYPSHRKMLFQTGGMSQEHSGTMSSVMKKGIQQSTKTPIKMPTISAAFFSFCSRHVSPSVWKVTVAWRTSAKKSSSEPSPFVQFTVGHKTLESKISMITNFTSSVVFEDGE